MFNTYNGGTQTKCGVFLVEYRLKPFTLKPESVFLTFRTMKGRLHWCVHVDPVVWKSIGLFCNNTVVDEINSKYLIHNPFSSHVQS